MKKINLLSLMLVLSFYNYSSAMQQKFVFQDNIRLDVLHYLIGLLGIKACDSKNHIEIKANSLVNGIYSGYLACKNFQNIYENLNEVRNGNSNINQAGNALLGLFNVESFVYNVQSFLQHAKIFTKSKKRAKLNKKLKLDLMNEKIKQVVWLTFNITLPYLCFASKRMYYDKIDFRDAFYENNSLTSATILYATSVLANSFDNQRRRSLYKKVKRETQRRVKQSF